MYRIWKSATDEPLVPFAIIGGVLFAVYGLARPEQDVETIEVRPATVGALEQMQQDLLGRPLTEQERQDAVEGYIDEEVLMREALRMELEKKDSRVRKRLLDVMRSTLDQPVAEPTRAELQAYFRENGERYVPGETITFDQVFFAYGSENEPDDPADFLAKLRGGADHTQLGNSMLLGHIMRDRSKDQLRQTLGKDFAEKAFSLPHNEWHGPVESQQGVHFLRVTQQRKSAPPSFDQMEDYLRQDWMFRKRRELQSGKIAEMRKRYRVVFAKGQ